MTARERFESKISVAPNGCHEWQGTITTHGYGHFWLDRRPQKASRVAWRFYRGEIPAGLLVLHTCDNRKCVNPEHLFLGTHPAKLTEHEVQAIRSRYSGHRGQKAQFAREYGVTQTMIGYILKGSNWKNVTPFGGIGGAP